MNIADSYNQWAPTYDSDDNKTRDLDKKATMATLEKLVNAGATLNNILELGSGTGKNTEYLAVHAQSLIGLDFSEQMLSIARTKVSAGSVEFRVCDLTREWPVEPHWADLIVCNLVLEHVEHLHHIFSQASRAIASNGQFYVCELHPYKQYAGGQARFKTDIGEQLVTAFIHHISDYVNAAEVAGFVLETLNEWFDDAAGSLPRLISFTFRKSN